MKSGVGESVERTAREPISQRVLPIADIEGGGAQTEARPIRNLASVLRSSSEHTQIQAVAAGEDSGEPESNAPGSSASSANRPPASTRRRILVIDDSDVMLDRIRRALEVEGHDVITTKQAVGNARHIPTCDLVIIDFHMPGIDGGTVIQSLRRAATSSDHTCQFYLYTSDAAIAKNYKKLGFDGVFTDKGDERALVRQVRGVFRILHMRAMQRKTNT